MIVVFAGCFSLLRIPLRVDRRVMCHGRCKMIMLALHNYRDVHKCFPPAFVADPQGRPIHSWRVLILPFLEEMDLYRAYNFNEPWNGPNNRKLSDRMPAQFACTEGGGGRFTDKVAVIGPHTMWPGPQSVRLHQVRDGSPNTIAVVEITGSDIEWLEPRDLYFNRTDFTLNGSAKPGLIGRHGTGVLAAMMDGTARWLDPSLRPETVRSLFTIDQGEPLPEGWW